MVGVAENNRRNDCCGNATLSNWCFFSWLMINTFKALRRNLIVYVHGLLGRLEPKKMKFLLSLRDSSAEIQPLLALLWLLRLWGIERFNYRYFCAFIGLFRGHKLGGWSNDRHPRRCPMAKGLGLQAKALDASNIRANAS